MLSLRNRFGIPGVISVIALVFAMFGGAYAATNSGGKATASAKAKRGPRGPKGPVGPAGPAGPTGPAGAKGDAGAQGAEGKAGAEGKEGKAGLEGKAGKNGTNGNTVLNGTGAPAGAIGANGDFYIDTAASKIYGPKTAGAWGSGTSLKGESGFTESLPSGKTETGVYGISGSASGELGELFGESTMDDGAKAVIVPTSFPIPSIPSPTFVFVPGTATGYGTAAPSCPGVTAGGIPQAASGKFCVYGIAGEPLPGTGAFIPSATVSARSPNSLFDEAGATSAGALLKITCSSPALGACAAKGLWAVSG
jgi:hypothetical protein